LSDFLGHNKNAVLWQVWTALILYVLLRFLAFCNSCRHGFKRFFCLLRSSVWDGFSTGNPTFCHAPYCRLIPPALPFPPLRLGGGLPGVRESRR